jgi:hypothetical protein
MDETREVPLYAILPFFPQIGTHPLFKLLFGHMYLSGMWCASNNIQQKEACLEEIRLCAKNMKTIIGSIGKGPLYEHSISTNTSTLVMILIFICGPIINGKMALIWIRYQSNANRMFHVLEAVG